MDCSVVVISRNRPRHLARLFGYFSTEQLDAPIYLGDASEDSVVGEIGAICTGFGKKLDIRYTPYEVNSSPMARLCREFEKVTTSTAIWVGDDDFVAPRALRDGTDYMSRTPDCSAVTGDAVTFSVVGDGAGGRINGLGKYPQKDYPQSLASDRLIAQSKDRLALTYSLRRTAFVQRMLQDIENLALPDDALGYYFFELLDSMLTVIDGKVKCLTQVMMARQTHARSTAATGRQGGDGINVLSAPAWPGLLAGARELLIRYLVEAQPDLGFGKAREIADTTLWIRARALLDRALAGRLGVRSGFGYHGRISAAILRLRAGRLPGMPGEAGLVRMLDTVERFPCA